MGTIEDFNVFRWTTMLRTDGSHLARHQLVKRFDLQADRVADVVCVRKLMRQKNFHFQ